MRSPGFSADSTKSGASIQAIPVELYLSNEIRCSASIGLQLHPGDNFDFWPAVSPSRDRQKHYSECIEAVGQ